MKKNEEEEEEEEETENANQNRIENSKIIGISTMPEKKCNTPKDCVH